MANGNSGVAVGRAVSPAPGVREGGPAQQLSAESTVSLAAQLDEFSGDPNFMTSLARGLLVIQAFSQRRPQLSISQLSKRTGLSRAS
ncbi:MAG TPA: helix-turn-helix domain-containing protein, partial [Candidatus Sulfotelmatobacter sp.]|nr:helix-turn-helix domain-containing protein [Candidatus Sulfotelmatobacter sp.]